MYERLLNETVKYISEQEEKELPILDIWQAMVKRSKKLKFDLPETISDFECLVEGDKRFIFVKPNEELPEVQIGDADNEFEVGEDYFEVEEIEKIGFDDRILVGLKDRLEHELDEIEPLEDDFVPHVGPMDPAHHKHRGTKQVSEKKQSSEKQKKRKR